jgi:hypothetical protein
LTEDGFQTTVDEGKGVFTITGSDFDAKGRIISKTAEMIRRT